MKIIDKDVASASQSRSAYAEELLAAYFQHSNWHVERHISIESGRNRHDADLVIRKGAISYVVEAKAAPEGRADRIVPLWAQACLQASKLGVASGLAPLAVVAAPEIGSRVAEQVLSFAHRYAPDVAVGVVDFAGLRCFRGPGIDHMPDEDERPAKRSNAREESGSLFSDLNQWMLKVLLAPDIPAHLLSAPRDKYKNASELAHAANVSVMSAFRFVQQLGRDGHLDESVRHLRLVRREELFQHWEAWALVKRPKELPVRFLLRGKLESGISRMLESGNACLALFAAAEALHVGFVHGVQPYMYFLRRGRPKLPSEWHNVVEVMPHEQPDVILREPPALQSVLRGLVHQDHKPCCDIIQVWLDVAAHPSRGREQADEIRRGALQNAIRGAENE